MTRWRKRLALIAGFIGALLLIREAVRLLPPRVRVVPQGAMLSNVTVVNPGRDRRANQTIVVRGGVIESISDRAPEGRLPPLTRIYEHRFVLPGLVDMNAHQPPRYTRLQKLFGLLFLAAGVTTVRDTGNFDGSIADMERRIGDGEFPWPRLVACGRIFEGDPSACRRSRVLRNAADASDAVDELAAAGARCVRVSWTLTDEVLAGVRSAAAARGLPVVGYVPPGVPLAQAQLADVQLISAATVSQPIRRLPDFWPAWQQLDAAGIDALVRASLAQGIAWTPTLTPWQLPTLSGPLAHSRDASWLALPRFYREVIWQLDPIGSSGTEPGGSEHPAGDPRQGFSIPPEVLSKMGYAVSRLHAAGARIHVGTGTPSPAVVPGASIYFELGNLLAAGFTLEEAWVAATRSAGESLGLPLLGTIAEGAPADLLIFREDPTQNMEALLGSLEAVVAQGRLYPKPLLDRMVMGHANYFRNPVYDWMSMTWVRLVTWWNGGVRVDCDWT